MYCHRKVQKQAPYSYVEHIIDGSQIKPTVPQLRFDNLKTFKNLWVTLIGLVLP
jgi:hypothetical protein